MKSAWTAVVALAALAVVLGEDAAPAHAQTAAPGRTAERVVLAFEQETIDMGPVSDAEPLMRPFTFTNVSDKTVTVHVSYCHFCIAPVLTATRVGPGEKASVVIEIDGSGRRGPVQATATIVPTTIPSASVTLTLKADIYPRLWIEPKQAFPRAVRGRGGSTTVTVIGRGPGFKVQSVDTGSPLVGYELGPIEKAEDQDAECYKQPLTLKISPDAPLGPLSATVRVTSSDPEVPVRDLALQGEVVGLVRADPQTVGGEAKINEPFSHEFDLVTDDPLGFVVESVETGDPSECTGLVMDVRPTPDPARWRARVSGVAPYRPRSAVDVPLRFETRLLATGEREALTVKLALYVPRPRDMPSVP